MKWREQEIALFAAYENNVFPATDQTCLLGAELFLEGLSVDFYPQRREWFYQIMALYNYYFLLVCFEVN